MPLNPNQIKTLQPGAYADQGGLYLCVRGSGDNLARIWQFRFTDLEGKRAGMDIGKFGDRDAGDRMSLSTARETCVQYRLGLKRGIDPRVKKRSLEADGVTLKAYADRIYPGWCVGKHPDEEKAWVRSLADLSTLHDKHPKHITTEDVLAALKPIWWEKPITANRTRERLEKLLDAARVELGGKNPALAGWGENPARWRGNLKFLLPSARKLNKKKPHRTMTYDKAPNLMRELSFDPGNAARCVQVGMLTATRSQEVRWMEWDELDLDNKKTWLIPGSKMKSKNDTADGKPHLVPLSDQAIAIITSMPRVGKYVFPSDAKQVAGHQAFRANALTQTIERAGFNSTMHGLRTTFRNWGADSREHNFRREVLEFCISHRVGDEAELSYWTSEMLDRRREVMDAWANYIKPKKTEKSKAKKPDLRLVG